MNLHIIFVEKQMWITEGKTWHRLHVGLCPPDYSVMRKRTCIQGHKNCSQLSVSPVILGWHQALQSHNPNCLAFAALSLRGSYYGVGIFIPHTRQAAPKSQLLHWARCYPQARWCWVNKRLHCSVDETLTRLERRFLHELLRDPSWGCAVSQAGP